MTKRNCILSYFPNEHFRLQFDWNVAKLGGKSYGKCQTESAQRAWLTQKRAQQIYYRKVLGFCCIRFGWVRNRHHHHQTSKKMSIILQYTLRHIMSSKMLQAQFQRNVKHFSVIATKSICVHFGVEAILYSNRKNGKMTIEMSTTFFRFKIGVNFRFRHLQQFYWFESWICKLHRMSSEQYSRISTNYKWAWINRDTNYCRPQAKNDFDLQNRCEYTKKLFLSIENRLN